MAAPQNLMMVSILTRMLEGRRHALIGTNSPEPASAALMLAGAAALGSLIRSQLFGVSASDGLTYAVVVPLLALTALVACWWPARRATAVDVLEVLRAE